MSFIARLEATISWLSQFPELKNSWRGLRAKVEIAPCPSRARCNFDTGLIVLDPCLFKRKIGLFYPDVQQSLFFEMCNLEQKEKFLTLLGQIKYLTPDQFVEEYERIEYQSALKAKKFARNHFRYEYWNEIPFSYTPDQFVYHYDLQQLSGHSGRIWERYAKHFPKDATYHGTLAIPPQEREFVEALVLLEARSRDGDLRVASEGQKALARLKHDVEQGGEFASMKSRVDEVEASSVL